LHPRSLYVPLALAPFCLVVCTIVLDALDASAVTLIYFTLTVLKIRTQPQLWKIHLGYVTAVSVVWLLTLLMSNPLPNIDSNLTPASTYALLYFILPLSMFVTGFLILRADFYQVIRRFSGIGLVFVSEVCIFTLHHIGIFKVQLSEIQFHSIFPFFHILYYLPAILWLLNSKMFRAGFGKLAQSDWIPNDIRLENALIFFGVLLLAFYNFMVFLNV